MKKLTLFIFVFFGVTEGFAQTQAVTTFDVKNKQIALDVKETSLELEGYDGDELIIGPATAQYLEIRVVEAGFALLSEGKHSTAPLKPVVLKEDARQISVLVPESSCKHLSVKVPRNAHLKLEFTNTASNGSVVVKDFLGELEVSGTVQVIKFDNISGPLTLSRGNGATSQSFGAAQKIVLSHIQWKQDPLRANSLYLTRDTVAGPATIVQRVLVDGKPANYDSIPKILSYFNLKTNRNFRFAILNIATNLADVDISIDESANVTVQVSTINGELYSDLPLTEVKQSTVVPKGRYIGELNGGGPSVIINTTNGNIFLRKEKPEKLDIGPGSLPGH